MMGILLVPAWGRSVGRLALAVTTTPAVGVARLTAPRLATAPAGRASAPLLAAGSAIVLVAAWLPARRAARIEPTLALRGQ